MYGNAHADLWSEPPVVRMARTRSVAAVTAPGAPPIRVHTFLRDLTVMTAEILENTRQVRPGAAAFGLPMGLALTRPRYEHRIRAEDGRPPASQEYGAPLHSLDATSVLHRRAVLCLDHLACLVRDRGTRRLLMYHDGVLPVLECALFLTHRLGVFEPPSGASDSGGSGATPASGRPLVVYQGA